MTEILGQSRAMGQIQAAVSSGRLHHAWIFHGPWGVGKFTAAIELARFLLCHSPQADLMGMPSPCDTCASCRLFREPAATSGEGDESPSGVDIAHPDFHVVTKELARFSDDANVRNRKLTNIPVDVLRQALLEPVYRMAQMQHGKVFVVDEAELIDTRGQNLLLKTLEEPPANTYIILVTSSEDKLLTTIRSRCQRVAFGPLPDEVIHQWLDRTAPEVKDADRQWLVNFAAGSLGRVQLTIRFDLFRWWRSVLPGVDQAVTGRPPGELGATMSALIDELAQNWVSQHKNASKEAANKMAAGLMLGMIGQHARMQINRLVARAPVDDPDAAEAMLEPWLHVIESLSITETALGANVNMGLAMDHLVSMMARPGVIHFSVN